MVVQVAKAVTVAGGIVLRCGQQEENSFQRRHLLGTSSAWRCRCGRARLSHVGLHPTALHCCELLNAGSKKVMTFH